MSDNYFAAALYEGTYSVGQDHQFNPIDRNAQAPTGTLKLAINPFLIHTPERVYLVDVGLGDFGTNTSCDIIRQNLDKHDLTEYDITDIFLSHLHFDHLGGLAERCDGFWELMFPEARLWTSKPAWQEAIDRETYYDEEKTEFLHFIDAKADLHYYEEVDESPYSDVRTQTIDGHTPHHKVLYFEGGDQKYMMAGDVIGKVSSVNHRYAAKYDHKPKHSMEMRVELAEKAYRENYTIMSYHDPNAPLAKLSDYSQKKGYRIAPVQQSPSPA